MAITPAELNAFYQFALSQVATGSSELEDIVSDFRRKAAASGQDAIPLERDETATQTPPDQLAYDAWLKRFRKYTEGNPIAPGIVLDDSRESIYEDDP